MTYTICQFFKVHVDLPIECSFLIPLIKCWESLVCLIAKNSGHIQCVMEKTWKVTLLIDTPYKGRSTYLEGNLPRQTLSYICSLDDDISPEMYSQKLLQPAPANFYVQKGLLLEWWSVCM
jgi:hypothetical protein